MSKLEDLNKKFSRDLDAIVDKLAYETMKAEKVDTSEVVETIKYIESTPQIKNMRKALSILDVILTNFEIGLFKNPETRIAIYSNEDDYCVCHKIPTYKWEELKEAIGEEE